MSYYNLFHGEYQQGKHVDEVLRSYFPDYSYKGVFFDIGAYEPINISNSYHFEMNNWDVHCFEANTLLINELQSLRKKVYNYAIYNENKPEIEFNVVKGIYGGGSQMAGISAIELDNQYLEKFGSGIKTIERIKVPQKTLNYVLENEIPYIQHIDILSIDVEGGELNVLKGIDLHKYTPNVILLENVFNNQDIVDYMYNHSYKLDKHIDYNQYFVIQ